jgi:hypothetical protein
MSRTVAQRHLPFFGTPLSTKIILRCGAGINILKSSAGGGEISPQGGLKAGKWSTTQRAHKAIRDVSVVRHPPQSS